jgi:hypothetical protein
VPFVGGQSSSLAQAWASHEPAGPQCVGAPLSNGHDASLVHASLHDPVKHCSGVPPKVGQSLFALQGVAEHTSNAATHVASSGQLTLDVHSVAQNPFPLASAAQCCSVPSAAREQS